jgi:hypothetical protein
MSGPGVTECGRVEVKQDRGAALSCLVAEVKGHRPFRVSIETYGLETIITIAVV